MRCSLHLASSLALWGLATSQTSTYDEPTVPTGTPVPGNYTGALRPQVHFSPPQNFMNDPNGCFVDANGTWHLYYQYDATGTVAGNQHWGHATSPDLYHWTNQQIALYPVNSSAYIFSGSIVTDPNNTSGFFPSQDNGVVAMFTLATYEPIMLQTQAIAYSLDGGYTFDMYEGNPVIDIGSAQFRDPKIVRYGDHWAAVISYAQDFTIGIFTSPDLKNWTHASNFTHHGLLGLQYECPNLVEVPVEDSDGETTWLLQISVNPGAPLGGSISEYFLGDFDGYTFTPSDNVTRITDFSKDAYAGQFFYGASPPVSINWASNWQYAQDVPTGPLEGWRSAMGTPREISVRSVERTGLSEVAKPYSGLSSVLGNQLLDATFANGTNTVDFSNVSSNAVYMRVNVTGIPSANSSGFFNFTLSSPISGEYVRGGQLFAGDQHFFLDRGGVKGFDNPFFTDKFSTTVLLNGSYSFEVVFDRSLLETFLDGGSQSSTTSFFAESPLTSLYVGQNGLGAMSNQTARVQVWELNGVWGEGTNLGNVTGGGGNFSTGVESRGRTHARMLL